MKINSKSKALLASGLLIISTSLAGCSNTQQEPAKQETQQEQTKNEETQQNENVEQKENENKDNSTSNNTDKKQAEITYYTFDINSEKMTPHTKKVDEVSVGNIITELVKEKVLPEGTKVNTAKVNEVDGVRIISVDVNSNFINFDQGSSSELLTLQAFANSLIKSFHVEKVKLTVDGKNYSSGHIVLEEGEYLNFK
ncbi:GerMN domain-containing protein [Peptostreptococcus faecalis]|uniref:GerMN domain-containing protein n=1 Tax=Peptostreptococcus faecalis TaxID=2045015 RepID=UPI000C7A9019|nr:GerMN domain-containing protein [Peptostreptococcus faecalis]